MKWTDRFKEALKAWRLGGQLSAGSLDRATSEVFGYSDGYIDPAKLVALSTSVYSAIDIRSSTLSSVPYKVYMVNDEGKHEVVNTGPAVDIFKRVNPFWTFPRLLQAVEMSMCVYGQAFIVIERDNRGTPIELWYAPADRMIIKPHPVDYIEKFVFHSGYNKQVELDPKDVIWIRGIMDPRDEFKCLSPLAAARLSVESSLDAMLSNQKIFKNGLNPGGILSPKEAGQALTKDQRELIEEQLNLRLRGSDKAHKLAVFSHPMQLDTPQLTPADAQFMDLLSWTLGDVARVFKIPPTKLQDFSTATYSNVEQADKAFYTDCIIPELERIAQELNEQLMYQFGEGYEIMFDFSQVRALQEDQTEITNQMVSLLAMGVPLNKLLQVYRPDLLPEDAEGYSWGDAPPAPVLLSAEDADVIKKNAEKVKSLIPAYGSPEHKKALMARDRKALPFERRARAAIREAQKLIVEGVNKRLSEPVKAIDDFSDEDYIDIIARAYASAGVDSILADAYARAGREALKRVGSAIDFDLSASGAIRFLEKRDQRFAKMIPADQWKELKASLVKGIENGEGTEGLKKIVETHPIVSLPRAEMVARTEVIGAYNGGLEEGWTQSGLEGQKVWLAALDNRTRETHKAAHGQQVALSDDFTLLSGAKGKAPGQTGVAAEDINCRCSLDYLPE